MAKKDFKTDSNGILTLESNGNGLIVTVTNGNDTQSVTIPTARSKELATFIASNANAPLSDEQKAQISKRDNKPNKDSQPF